MIFNYIEKNNNNEALLSLNKVYRYKDLYSIKEMFINKLRPRSIVIIKCQNEIDCIAGYLGIVESNLVPILVGKNISKSSILEISKNYEASYLYAPTSDFLNLKKVVSIDTYSIFETNFEDQKIIFDSKIGQLLLTSGSTGNPKCVVHSYENIESNLEAISNYLGINFMDTGITTLPFNYTYGLSIVNSHIYKGAKVCVTNKSFLTNSFWEEVTQNNITNFNGVPYIYEILIEKKLLQRLVMSPSLRFLTQAGGRLKQQHQVLLAKWSKKNDKDFYIMYGQTEATARISYLSPEKIGTKIGSIGQPIAGGDLTVTDADNKIIYRPYEIGELVYKGPNVSLGYSYNIKDLRERKKQIELKTGDLGYFDQENDFYITGRKNRDVKIHGVRVSMDRVEKYAESQGIDLICLESHDKLLLISENEIPKEFKNKISSTFNISLLGVCYSQKIKLPRLDSGKIDYKTLNDYAENFINRK